MRVSVEDCYFQAFNRSNLKPVASHDVVLEAILFAADRPLLVLDVCSSNMPRNENFGFGNFFVMP